MPYTNVRHQDYYHTATLKVLPFEVFFNEKFFKKILSFPPVASKFSIAINTKLYPTINVYLHGGTSIIFK